MAYKKYKQFRIPDHDYSTAGYYFVTICSKNRECLFGSVVGDKVELTAIGQIVHDFWQQIPDHNDYIDLDAFVVMPNHIHGIIVIDRGCRNGRRNGRKTVLETDYAHGLSTVPTTKRGFQPEPKSLSIMIRNYKAAVTTEIRRKKLSKIVWQPRFYDHVIRDEISLLNIREYIHENPINWKKDRNYSCFVGQNTGGSVE